MLVKTPWQPSVGLAARPGLTLMRLSGALARGFTLIELMVVVAMVAILATLATPSLRNFAANQALGGVTSDLLGATMTARATAINRNLQTIVEPLSGTDWTSGWRVYVDKDGDGAFDATKDEQVSISQPAPDTVAINTSSVSNCTKKDKFAYRADGFLNVGGTLGNGGVPFISKVTGRDRCVVIERSGRARICGTGSDTC